MTDKEYMQDILLTSKTLTGLYHYATQEASTQNLHTQFKTNLNEALDMQHNIYGVMQQNGWYPAAQAPAQQISQVRSKYQAS